MNIIELIGKRILISDSTGFGRASVNEVKVIEVSPSGNWVKLMNMYGNKFWKPLKDISLVEVLKSIEKPPKDSDL